MMWPLGEFAMNAQAAARHLGPALEKERVRMVERQIAHRGVHSRLVLDAMKIVPRERFLPPELWEFAYDDTPLPIAEGQTISQPYIVAMMIEALELQGGEKVLEIGTGSGYAAAVLSRIAAKVFTVERIGQLAEKSAGLLSELGYSNVCVLHGDGTRGWPDHAPFDAIVVAAGGPEIPESLKSQLKIGGRLVIPVGKTRRTQELTRVTRVSAEKYAIEDLADVRFVPLVGAEGWRTAAPRPAALQKHSFEQVIASFQEPFTSIDAADLGGLMQRIGDARLVLLGESTHGTSEFYRLRERITRELIEHKGFSFVAIEGDWPDAARIDQYVRHSEHPASEWTAFARFPVWMWRNREVRTFVDWLRMHNRGLAAASRTAFYGLDLYSLYNSIQSVLEYLDRVDPAAAAIARHRYACLAPWQADPAVYGQAALTGAYRSCETEVTAMLKELLQKRFAYSSHDGERFLDAVQNARLVANAEHYYRIMYYGSRASWNLRDSHMYETLRTLLDHHGPASKGVIWAHNSHVGDSAATEMSARAEYNIGHLCKRDFGRLCYSIGFGTDRGTVAAAANWNEPMHIMDVRPALTGSYEYACRENGTPQFFLPLRTPRGYSPSSDAMQPRLERAIGVVYRPENELQSHYFEAVLPRQFDEYVWIHTTKAITPLATEELAGLPETYPFGL
jgi:protein-L-isoaspartate(D-aspartate) O-methyltransferase